MSQAKDGTITVADAYELFPDEWVLMEITRKHNDYRKERGRVLAHSPSRGDIDEPYNRFRKDHPSGYTYEFFAGEPFPADVVVIL